MTAELTRASASVPEAAWRAGRLDARRAHGQLLFGRVYEDSAIERAAFAGARRVFCIGSAGCTALALCDRHEVSACDINPAQIEYIRRRVRGGGLEMGTADRLMAFLRGCMPLAGWSRRRVQSFLSFEDPAAQLAFFRRTLDTWRFRAGLEIVLSPLWLRGLYAPALLQSLPPHFARVLRVRLERAFARHPNRHNPYAQALLSGHSSEAESWSFEHAARIELVTDDAAAYLERCRAGSFDGVSLSNILDGASAAYRARLLGAVRHAAAPGAPVVQRSFAEPARVLEANHAERDRSMLWGIVDVRPVEALMAE